MKKFFTLRKGNAKGFTLVELMIVVAIIGILAAIAIPQFSQYRKRGYVATINSDVKNAFSALAAMIADNSALETDDVAVPDDLEANGFNPSNGVTTSWEATDWDDYDITSTGLNAWALNDNTATMNARGVFKSAVP